MSNVLFSSEFDPSKLVFEAAKSQKEGGSIKSSRINYLYNEDGESEPLLIQTAQMKVPFGIGNDEKFGDGKKWDVRLSFQGQERNKKIQRFREAMDKLNEAVIQKALDNCGDWLNDDDHDLKTIKKSFKSSIKKSKKEEYADMFKVSVPFKKDNTGPYPHIKFYNENQEEIEWTDVKPGCSVVCILNIAGVWMAPGTGQFGVSVRLSQMQVYPPKRISGYQIRKEADYDEGAEDNSDDEDNDSIDADVEEEEVVEVESDDDE